MKKPLPEIHESIEELKHLLIHEQESRKKQRLHALYLLKSGQARTRLAVAVLLGVHRRRIGTWLARYAQGGFPALMTIGKPPGKPPQLSPEVLTHLTEYLAQTEGAPSYKAIQAYLEQE